MTAEHFSSVFAKENYRVPNMLNTFQRSIDSDGKSSLNTRNINALGM